MGCQTVAHFQIGVLIIERTEAAKIRLGANLPGDGCSLPFWEPLGSIPNRFEAQARATPTALAVMDGPRRWSFQELNYRANHIAHRILKKAGPDSEPVAMLVDLEAEAVAAIYGVLKAGKFYVPLDPQSPPARSKRMIEQTGATLLITNGKHLDMAKRLADSGLTIIQTEVASQAPADNLDLSIASDSLAYVMYTSGSTGEPKGVMHNHRNVLADMSRQGRDLRTTSDDRYGLLFSAASSASCCSIFGALLNGAAASCFDLHRQSVSDMRQWLIDDRITICDINVATLRLFAATLSPGDTFPDMRVIAPGGEPLYKNDVELCRQIFSENCVVQNSLGTTETRTATQYFITSDMPIDTAIVPVGWPVHDKRILLLDENGDESDEGEIAICSKCISPGYWKRPDLTSKVFITRDDERIYLTGDIGRRMDDDRIMHLGRKDFQVKIRGYRVEVAEVENAILEMVGVQEAAVIPRKDHNGELRLVAFVVVDPSAAGGVTLNELRKTCRASLPPSSWPTQYFTVPKLPKTNNGKLARRLVHDLEGNELVEPPAADQTPQSPRNEHEAKLCAIFEQVLGRAPIAPTDDFFDRGGDSIRALDCILRIEQQFGHRMTPLTFREHCTAEHLASLLSTKPADKGLIWFSQNRDQPRLYLLPGLFGTALELESFARQIDAHFTVVGLEPLEGTTSDNLETIAALYVDRLLNLEPHGPFRLAGYSFGGMLAYEAARQLRSAGHEIEFLAAIDSSPDIPCAGLRHNPLRFCLNAPLWLIDELRLVGFSGIKEKAVHYWNRALRRREAKSQYNHFAMEDAFECRELPESARDQVENHLNAIQNYRPPITDLQVALFLARIRPLVHSLNPNRAWNHLTKSTQVYPVPGNHQTMLDSHQLCSSFNKALRSLAR